MSEPNKEGDVPTIPANIRAHLKQFENHQTVTCLECGYSGMMGVKGRIVPWFLSWWTILFVIFVFTLFVGAGVVMGIFLGLLRLTNTFIKYVVICPSCNAELNTK